MNRHPEQGIERFLDALQIRVTAFGICEIGRQFSLRCAPMDSVVVHFVLRGEGYLECRYGRFPIHEGMVIIVPKNFEKDLCGLGPVEHVRDAEAVCTSADDLISFRACLGEPDLILGCAELSSTISGNVPLFDQAKRPIFEKSNDALLSALFGMMLRELRNPGLGTVAFVSALMKQVLIVILRSQPNDESSILLMSSVRLAGAVAAILDHPENNHTVDSLAALAGMSRARFCDHFNSAYNCTPKSFVQTARLAAAARLLRGSALPVKAVAASVGYASRSHFSRAFVAKFGVDPTAYRVRLSEDAAAVPLPGKVAEQVA